MVSCSTYTAQQLLCTGSNREGSWVLLVAQVGHLSTIRKDDRGYRRVNVPRHLLCVRVFVRFLQHLRLLRFLLSAAGRKRASHA